MRPAYLELRESRSGELEVLWKTPMIGDMRLSLAPMLSGASQELTPLATRLTGDAAVQSWRLKLLEPLRGRSLHVDGLTATMTDVLVRIEFADGDILDHATDAAGAAADDTGAIRTVDRWR